MTELGLEARPDFDREAIERYERAKALADQARAAWEQAGRPLTVVWPNGTESEAPLLKLLREAERDAERFMRAIPRSKRPGRDPVAVVKASLGKSPAVQRRSRQLRAVT